MIVQNEFVVCSSVDPDGRKLFVEVTKLLLVQHLFYDRWDPDSSDEVDAREGWLTVVGNKVYRVTQIDPETVKSDTNIAMYEVIVDWADLKTKPESLQ